MRALILNSGLGARMGDLTKTLPKCMTQLATGETILQRQLCQLEAAGVLDIVITTGPFAEALQAHALASVQNAKLVFVNNPVYSETNYIYSIYLARAYLQDSLISLHGDLVFSDAALAGALAQPGSVMAVSSTQALPEKDFKAVVKDGTIQKVGVAFFDSAVAAQPLYKLDKRDWMRWLKEIERFVERDEKGCYAENALNALEGACRIAPYDVKDALCAEIDNPEDLKRVNTLMAEG